MKKEKYYHLRHLYRLIKRCYTDNNSDGSCMAFAKLHLSRLSTDLQKAISEQQYLPTPQTTADRLYQKRHPNRFSKIVERTTKNYTAALAEETMRMYKIFSGPIKINREAIKKFAKERGMNVNE